MSSHLPFAWEIQLAKSARFTIRVATMAEPQVLTLSFLGSREYLQGTTLFDALRLRIKQGENIRFKVARLMKTDRVSIDESATPNSSVAHYAATLGWKVRG